MNSTVKENNSNIRESESKESGSFFSKFNLDLNSSFKSATISKSHRRIITSINIIMLIEFFAILILLFFWTTIFVDLISVTVTDDPIIESLESFLFFNLIPESVTSNISSYDFLFISYTTIRTLSYWLTSLILGFLLAAILIFIQMGRNLRRGNSSKKQARLYLIVSSVITFFILAIPLYWKNKEVIFSRKRLKLKSKTSAKITFFFIMLTTTAILIVIMFWANNTTTWHSITQGINGWEATVNSADASLHVTTPTYATGQINSFAMGLSSWILGVSFGFYCYLLFFFANLFRGDMSLIVKSQHLRR